MIQNLELNNNYFEVLFNKNVKVISKRFATPKRMVMKG